MTLNMTLNMIFHLTRLIYDIIPYLFIFLFSGNVLINSSILSCLPEQTIN